MATDSGLLVVTSREQTKNTIHTTPIHTKCRARHAAHVYEFCILVVQALVGCCRASLTHTHPRHGVKKRQAKSAGKQKVSTAKVKEAKPDSTCVLVYSLGHEMYKWGA